MKGTRLKLFLIIIAVAVGCLQPGVPFAASSDSIIIKVKVLYSPPEIDAVLPSSGAIVYIEDGASIEVTAHGVKGHTLEYRFCVDDNEVQGWGTSAVCAWAPREADIGSHKIKVQVRASGIEGNPVSVDYYAAREPVLAPEN